MIHPVLRSPRPRRPASTSAIDAETSAKPGLRKSAMHDRDQHDHRRGRVEALLARASRACWPMCAPRSTTGAEMRETLRDAAAPSCAARRSPGRRRAEQAEAADFLAGSTTTISPSSAIANTAYRGAAERRLARHFAGQRAGPPARPSHLGVRRACAIFARLPPECALSSCRRALLIISKSNRRATVHRPVRMDAIGVRRFGADGAGRRPTGCSSGCSPRSPMPQARARSRCCATRSRTSRAPGCRPTEP